MQVHYGRASLARVTSLPAYFVFPQTPLDPAATSDNLCQAITEAVQNEATAGSKAIVMLPDQLYLWAMSELQQFLHSKISQVLPTSLHISALLVKGGEILSGSCVNIMSLMCLLDDEL